MNNEQSPVGLKIQLQRLTAYSAAAAATAATTNCVNAVEVIHDIPDVAVTVDDANTVFNMVTGDVTPNTTASVVSSSSAFAVRAFVFNGDDRGFLSAGYSFGVTTGIGVVGQPSVFVTSYPGVEALASGVILPTQNFVNYYGAALGDADQTGWGFAEGQTAFVGLQFKIRATGAIHYGWAQLTRDASNDDYILHGFGYNDDADTASQTSDTVDPPVVAGDYNGDGSVDAADYTVWRDSLGAMVPNGTGADGDGDGEIGSGDYDLWRASFGTGSSASSAGPPRPSVVPEPSAGLLALAAGATGVAAYRRRKVRG